MKRSQKSIIFSYKTGNVRIMYHWEAFGSLHPDFLLLLLLLLLLSLDLCLPTHCRCGDYGCPWSHSMPHIYTQTRTHTVGRTSLEEWSACRRDFQLPQSQQTNIHDPAGFETTIPASELPQNHALDCAATGIGYPDFTCSFHCSVWLSVSDACKLCYCIVYFKRMYVDQ
jgi:hypothetical protein